MQTEIIYEDKYILVAYKPAGLATQTAKVGEQDMVSEIKNYLAKSGTGRAPYLGVVHRLDQPVEGLLVFAKEKQTAAALTKQLEKGTLNKQYYAAICGKPDKDSGELVDYMYKDNAGKAKIVNDPQESGIPVKKAVLQYRVIKELSAEQGIFMADIHIETGRFHQIRAQMANAGMPLLGDSKYGTEASTKMSREKGVRFVALCAYCIEILHPVTKEKLIYKIEPKNKAFFQ